ncbi:MAG: thiamine phosphate synthase [Hyphomonadaceae bacterium]
MSRRCRLYLITPPEIADIAAFARELDAALDAGDVASLQIRLKSREGVPAADHHILELGRHVVPRAQDRGVAVLINDRPDLAVELGADGVHIGQKDMPYARARKLVGDGAIVGVTCHDSRHLAMEAGEAGADYVAFGAFHPTDTKDPATRAEPDLLAWWQEMMELPCVAIGGITAENARPLVEAGADFLAVSAGVWRAPGGPGAAVKAFNTVFDELAT